MVLFLNLSHNSFIVTHIQFPFRDLFRYWVTVHLPSVLFPTISIFSQNWTSDKSFFLKKTLKLQQPDTAGTLVIKMKPIRPLTSRLK